MPLKQPVKAEEVDALVEGLEHGLRVKLDEYGIPLELQAYLSKIGYKTVALFQCLATSQE